MHHKFFLSHSLRASSYEPGLGWFSVPHLATAIKCDILSIVLCMLACFWRCKVPSVKSPLPTCKTCRTFILLYSLFFPGGGGVTCWPSGHWTHMKRPFLLYIVFYFLTVLSRVASLVLLFEVIVKVWLSYLYSRHLSLYLLSASTKQINFHFVVA